MMVRYSAVLQMLSLSFASAFSVPHKTIVKRFSTLVIFGDSYTDQGVYQYTPVNGATVATPKTVLSSGGRIWAQYVQQYANITLYDYAVSGAVCSSTFSKTKRSGVSENQIPAFLADASYISNTTLKPMISLPTDQTVYSIWIGTNDLGNGAFLAENQPKNLTIMAYIDCVYAQLDRLYAFGARKFVLMNIAPLDLTPQYSLPENGGLDSPHFWTNKLSYNTNITQISEKMREYSTLVNGIYETRTPFYVKLSGRYPESSFAVFDVHSLMSDIWHQPSLYLNGTGPLNVTGSISGCAISSCPGLLSRDSFMWYDDLHPSEQTDRIIAREFVNVVKGTSNWTTYWSN